MVEKDISVHCIDYSCSVAVKGPSHAHPELVNSKNEMIFDDFN